MVVAERFGGVGAEDRLEGLGEVAGWLIPLRYSQGINSSRPPGPPQVGPAGTAGRETSPGAPGGPPVVDPPAALTSMSPRPVWMARLGQVGRCGTTWRRPWSSLRWGVVVDPGRQPSASTGLGQHHPPCPRP